MAEIDARAARRRFDRAAPTYAGASRLELITQHSQPIPSSRRAAA